MDVSAPELAQSQVDVIAVEGRWQRALFTTYALSLAFFESYLLPHLRRTQCAHVTVLADVDGYRSSLMERRSQSVGQEYALVPVRAKGHGIFHPKVTYLWGESRDVLLVGSGNLTFGGHGRNLEVLDVLTSDRDSQAFLDFADFAEGLAGSSSFELTDSETLMEFSVRATAMARASKGEGSARLLHSLNVPIADQLLELAATRNDWQELLVLSPYHSPDAAPVRRLVEGLKVEKLSVGVPGNAQEGSAFPFATAGAWGVTVQPVHANTEAAERTLHAKWIELRGSETWVLTGSINATAQALTTTKNVEVGVLRTGLDPDPGDWTEVSPPPYVPSDFHRLDREQVLILHAEITGPRIVGKVLGCEPRAQTWAATLEQAEETITSGTVEVTADGTFDWQPALGEHRIDEPLQLRMACEGTIARGWVHSAVVLRLPAAMRAARLAVNRLLQRAESLDDYQAVIDLVGIHAGRLRIAGAHAADSGAPADPVDVDFVFSVQEALARRDFIEAHPQHTGGGAARSPHSRAQSSADTLDAIARALLGQRHGRLGRAPLARGPSDQDLNDQDDPPDEKEMAAKRRQLEAARTALEHFNESIGSLVQSAEADDPRVPSTLLVWLNVNLDMRMRRFDDRTGALVFADEWLRIATRRCGDPEKASALLVQTVYGIAAALSLHAADMAQSGAVVARMLGGGRVHPWLECFVRGPVAITVAHEQAERWFHYDTAQALVDRRQEAALVALGEDLKRPTCRGALEAIVRDIESGRRPLVPEGIFDEKDLRLLHRLAPTRGKPARFTRVSRRQPMSCRDHHRQIDDIRNRLETHRIAACVHCHDILVLLEP
jgi:hypothetical protein